MHLRESTKRSPAHDFDALIARARNGAHLDMNDDVISALSRRLAA